MEISPSIYSLCAMTVIRQMILTIYVFSFKDKAIAEEQVRLVKRQQERIQKLQKVNFAAHLLRLHRHLKILKVTFPEVVSCEQVLGPVSLVPGVLISLTRLGAKFRDVTERHTARASFCDVTTFRTKSSRVSGRRTPGY